MEAEIPKSFEVTSVHELAQVLHKLPSDAELVDWWGRKLVLTMEIRNSDNDVSVRTDYIRKWQP